MLHAIRRSAFRHIASGLFVICSGVGMMIAEAEAAPIMNAIPDAAAPDSLVTTVRTTCWWQGGRRICQRRPVRRVCWWSHGRRVCTWR